MVFIATPVQSYIPSPSSSEFSIGSLEIRYYGLMIALGVLALIWISIRRFQKQGLSQDLPIQLAWVAVPSGLVGARIYHLITDWDEYSGRWGDFYKIQEGGLGIPGAVIGAAIGLWIYARYKRHDLPRILDIAIPIVPLAQAIGRLGNWFNQELYGRPSDLPWAVEIDPQNRVQPYLNDATYHPFFLYEGLWSLCLMGFLLYLEKLQILKKGQMFAVFVMGYTSARIGLEFLRVDFANEILGVRVNVWTMSGFWLLALAYFLFLQLKQSPSPVQNQIK